MAIDLTCQTVPSYVDIMHLVVSLILLLIVLLDRSSANHPYKTD